MFMRILTNMARVFVGILFIMSGLVKANDPNGLGIKMTEFFNIWNTTFLIPYALGLAIAMIIFEIIAGLAILIGYKIKLFSTLTLLLIIFFTFLTGYAYITGKPATCGCFGDCIPITSKQSFTKDLVLLALALLIFAYSFYIKPLFNNKIALSILSISLLSCGILTWYVLSYLPVKDCLAFTVGTNLKQIKYGNLKDASKPTLDDNIFYLYKKATDTLKISQVDFIDEKNADKYGSLEDSGYEFMKIDTVTPKAKPILTSAKDSELNIAMRLGLTFKNQEGEDVTKYIITNDSTQYLLFVKDLSASSCKQNAIEAIKKAAGKKQVYLVTTNAKIFDAKAMQGVGLLGTNDDVAVKALARSSATLMVLNNGVITAKYGCAAVANALK